MRIISILFILMLFMATANASTVVQVDIDGVINPSTVVSVENAIKIAKKEKASLLLIRINTPGGLVDSTVKIIQMIDDSEIPVVTYVGPSGAISASAGSFVLLAGHIAAMSPSTSVGAATPVQVGVTGISPVENKTVNYMASYIRSIAESRGRPPDIAEKFVTEALSLTAREAMEAGVIDFMADSVEDLLKEINGMEINVKGRPVMVDTSEYELIRYEKGLTEEIMNVLANPQVAAILLLIGIYGLIFGLSSPGTYIPETIGIIALVLALYGLGTFEVNVLGIILIILGVILSIAELVTPTYGGLTVAAAVSFILGALLLPKEPMLSSSFYREFAIAVGGAVVVLVIFFTVAFTAILRIRKRKKAVGGEELIGLQGEVVEVYDGKALIRIRGEIWRAEVEEKLEKGDKVVVVDRDGLILLVKKVNNGLV